jgi:hypothetical protein
LTRFYLVRIFGWALLAYGPMVLAHAICITGKGGWVIAGVEIFVLAMFAALLAFIAALFALASPGFRRTAVSTLIISGSVVLLFVPALYISAALRSYGFHLAAQRSAPLISAIEQHMRDTGRPPSAMQDLIPRYLPSIPDGLPELELITGKDAMDNYEGNEWVLRALVSTGMINWDLFMYWPKQNYPDTGYGGWIERIDRWAYVHE